MIKNEKEMGKKMNTQMKKNEKIGAKKSQVSRNPKNAKKPRVFSMFFTFFLHFIYIFSFFYHFVFVFL